MQNFSEKCEVSNNEKLGRHLVASIDISPGEIILEESPLFIAPHWECEQMKCSKCFGDSFVMCRKCQVFPLCIDCSTHDEFDCDFFKNCAAKISKNLLVKNYAIFAALKLLLLIENEKTTKDVEAIFSKKCNLDDDDGAYRDSEMWNEHMVNVVTPILKSGIADVFKRVKVNADFLHKLCILIDANSFEVTGKDGDSLKGVFVHGAQFPHHCVPNTVVSIDDGFKMQIYAAVPIQRGEIIYNSYANPLMGTSQRQHYLLLTKHIKCTCARCIDPTELGTHMSSMKCKQCSDGYAVCTDPVRGENWICMKCSAVMDAIEMHKLLADVSGEMVNANGNMDLYENLLAKYSALFHDNHFLIIDIKQNIATILRAILMNPMCKIDKKMLQRRVQLCKEIIPVVRAVLPGISKLYAIALFEYLVPFLELIDLEIKDKDISLETYLRKQEMAKEIANDAMQNLTFEPSKSPEGHLLQCIEMELADIEENIKKQSTK